MSTRLYCKQTECVNLSNKTKDQHVLHVLSRPVLSPLPPNKTTTKKTTKNQNKLSKNPIRLQYLLISE